MPAGIADATLTVFLGPPVEQINYENYNKDKV